jgi:predicted transcriptional regulator
MKIGILIGLLFFLGAPAFALNIEEYQANAYIVDSKLVEEVTLRIYNDKEEPLARFTYPFGGKLKNLTVHDSTGELEHSSKYAGEKTYVTSTLRGPLLTDRAIDITYEFYLDEQITQKETTYILSTTHSLLANVKTFDFTLTLPEGHGIAAGQIVSPHPDFDSEGRHVILVWNLHEPIPPELREFDAIVLYENLLGEKRPWWDGKKNYIYLIIIAVMLFASVNLSKRIRTKKLTNDKIDILKEDEQAIMRLIIETDGIDQREIQRETDFSKTKVSKILSELEKRGVIRKEQAGRRNKIFLTKELKEP